jgi:hypothetical protein
MHIHHRRDATVSASHTAATVSCQGRPPAPCQEVPTRVPRASLPLARILAVALVGCAHGTVPSGSPGGAPGSAERQEGAVLAVENNTSLDVRIFLLRAGMPTRLGTVTGMSMATFDLEPDMIAREIRFYATPVGGWRRTITDVVVVESGQIVSLHLDNMMRSYRLSVW